MQTDVWSVTLDSDADFYVESITPSGAGALTLSANQPALNGAGYRVIQTSATGDNTGVNFVITGIAVGGNVVTETLAGANGSVNPASVSSVNYFSVVTSITVSAGTTGAITVGYGGSLALPRTRIKDWYYVGDGSAGEISVVNDGEVIPRLRIVSPATTTPEAYSQTLSGEGILVGQSGNKYAVVTTSDITSYTLTCG
jgi:hypothetical protein